MTYKVKGIKDEEAARYECLAYTLIAHRRSCAFCKCCTDTFYDYTNGPYLFFCSKHIDATQEILRDGCDDFEEDL